MNSNLYRKEFKRNRKNLLIWSSIVIGFTVMVLSIFPSMANMGKELDKLMSELPPELMKAMGMDADTWSSILGFYSTYFGIYIVVLMSIYTTSTSTGIISKEEKDKTSEFLLTRPITRTEIFNTKMAVMFTLVGIMFVAQTIIAFVFIELFKTTEIDFNVFGVMQLNGLILTIFFTCIGVILSMYVEPKKNFMGIVVGLTFGSYFLNALSKSTEAIHWLGYFTPFHYMDFTISDPNYSFNWIPAILMLLVSGCVLWFSRAKYVTKDIVG